MIHAFRASLPDLRGKEPPKRLLVAKWGRNDTTKGPFTVNETTARFLPAVQRILGFDTVAIDFEHNTVPGSAEYEKTAEPRTVAGHGVPRVVPGEGLFIEEIRWTPEGEKSVREGHHPDLSPAIKANDNGEVVLLHSTALCRQGACMDLQVFTAALTPGQLSALSAQFSASHSHSQPMNYKELLCLILGLDANNATDAQITEATKGFATKLATALGQAGTITVLNAELTSVKQSLAALQGKLDKTEREALVAAAVRDGKVIPHGAEVDKLSNEAFAAVLVSLPANVVPLDKRTPELVKTFTVAAPGGSAVGDEVRRQLGLTQEQIDKHNKR